MAARLTENEAARWLLERDNFLVLTHIRPDGDTLGCAAGLCAALRAVGKTCWAAENKGVTSTYLADIQDYFAPADYAPEHIVAVDIATENLFPPEFAAYKGSVALCIDHHPSNEGYAHSLCLDASAAACGEILYRICVDGLKVMNKEIARALYLAVSTDCGCFVYDNTTPETHRIAGALMTYGDFYRQINKRCFQTRSRKRMELESRLLQSAEYFEDGRVVIGAVTRSDMAQVAASEADAEELSSLLRQIEGVQAAATLRELADGSWKLSLRTDPDYLNATETCALMGGGGHKAASGARQSGLSQQEMRELVLACIRKKLL
ncbi:MAG: DHH family phosphoesterase [Oscillospiraceae bacterium]|nr:DHH family phosphoesterase [Oscillospiraceae bacterium]